MTTILSVVDPNLPVWQVKANEGMAHPEGVGDAIMFRQDGSQIRAIDVLVDSISPLAANDNTVAVEFPETDTVMHFANISHWFINYRL